METILTLVTMNSTTFGERGAGSKGKLRFWRYMDGMNCIGRFIPDSERRSLDQLVYAVENRSNMRNEDEVPELEVNLQLGTLTLKASLLRPLDESITKLVDYKAIFGEVGSGQDVKSKQIQCADIERRQHRLWVLLVGRRHDVQYWMSETKGLRELDLTRPFSLQNTSRREKWISDALGPYFTIVPELNNISALFAPNAKQQREKVAYARLLAVSESVTSSDDSDGKEQVRYQVVREIVIFSKNLVVNVFNLLESGRRYYRSLIFSSDSSFTYQSLPHIESKDMPPATTNGYICREVLTPDSLLIPRPRPSLVISRNFGISHDEMQTFLPSRFLRGLIPVVLLDEYEFWQSPDNSLTGYPKVKSQSKIPTFLRVEFLEIDGDPFGTGNDNDVEPANDDEKDADPIINSGPQKRKDLVRVCRCPQDESQVNSVDITGKTLFLMNILYAREDTSLSLVADFLVRFEDLSHVLVWTSTEVYYPWDPCTIDLIEMPRLKISFTIKSDSYGRFRLFSNDQEGMFLSRPKSLSLRNILKGVPQAILLENQEGSYGVLVPASRPALRHPWSYLTNQFDTSRNLLVFDRASPEWNGNLKSPNLYFPVHLTSCFLFSQSLTSAMYLLLLRFLNRDYCEVFRLAEACVSDEQLTPDEEQVFCCLAYVNDDHHPDAHACRLKVLLVLNHSSVVMGLWDLEHELYQYYRKKPMVSCACRFSIHEEFELMALCGISQHSLIENRRVMVVAMLSGVTRMKALPNLPKKMIIGKEFDSIVDKSCMFPNLENQEKELKQFSKTNYIRPDDPLLTGLDML